MPSKPYTGNTKRVKPGMYSKTTFSYTTYLKFPREVPQAIQQFTLSSIRTSFDSGFEETIQSNFPYLYALSDQFTRNITGQHNG